MAGELHDSVHDLVRQENADKVSELVPSTEPHAAGQRLDETCRLELQSPDPSAPTPSER